MTTASNRLNAINNAFALIGKPVDTTHKTSAVLPTARTRGAIDKLSQTNPKELAEGNVPLKPLLQDLFNWDGQNHVNKPLIRAFNEAVNTPGKYPHVVELTGFLAALAPLLEADQIARMYSLVNEVNTAFAPSKYTIQLSNRLKAVFSDFSKERIERLASSLWESSHQGRWWNLAAGIPVAMEPETPPEASSPDAVFRSIVSNFDHSMKIEEGLAFDGIPPTLVWNRQNQESFARIKPSQAVALLAERFVEATEDEKAVNPDIAVFLSSLPWLAPYQRPESPINGLMGTLMEMMDNTTEDYRRPKKPRTFVELFPGLKYYEGATTPYPAPPEMSNLHIEGATIRFIQDQTQLASNASFMGNCTMTYKDRLARGEAVMLYIEKGNRQYNCAITNPTSWRIQEINSRHNAGNVDKGLRDAITTFVKNLPPASPQYLAYLEQVKNYKGKKNSEQQRETYKLY